MTAILESELSRLSVEEKLKLIERLWADVEPLELPPGILSENDPKLEAELHRRLQYAKAHPETLMTLEQFKKSFGDK